MECVTAVEMRTGNYCTGVDHAGAVALPGAADGRVAHETEPEQPAWGWLAPALVADPDASLTRLPSDPVGYTARQQDAVRRDVAGQLESYLAYEPEPFAGC